MKKTDIIIYMLDQDRVGSIMPWKLSGQNGRNNGGFLGSVILSVYFVNNRKIVTFVERV